MAGKPTAEQLWRAVLRGPLRTKATSANNQWAGLTAVVSGAATAVVSTTNVDSDSIILATVYGNATNTASGFNRGWEVKSINPGNAFVMGTADGIGPDHAITVMWLIVKQ